jgi:AraC-like DNA-binding protein
MTCIAYKEHRPSAELSKYVDSIWWIGNNDDHRPHRVLPDGCADILFLNPSESRHELLVMGAMTQANVFDLPKGQFVGVRFRPGMASHFVRIPGSEMVNTLRPLEEAWGRKAKRLADQLLETGCQDEFTGVFESYLVAHLNGHFRTQPDLSPTQRALDWAAQRRGRVRMDDLARLAGLSTRQFRRLCLELTGLTPKYLCRAIRVSNAATQLMSINGDGLASLALDCGYYDQAHFINEFRALAGLTPTDYRAEIS